jgi:hypothetical protein
MEKKFLGITSKRAIKTPCFYQKRSRSLSLLLRDSGTASGCALLRNIIKIQGKYVNARYRISHKIPV